MADLDDFFAKKDRKKSKTKKFATTEEVAKKLEDTTKKQKEIVKKERQPENNEAGTEIQDQDEWREFEEEKKDYTGLKIGNLTLNAEVEQSNGNQENSGEQQQDSVEEGGNEGERKAVGPWKKLGGDAPEAPQPVEEKKPETPSNMPNVTAGTYVPPSRRNQPSQPQSHSLQPSRLRSKAAPDINNEDFFPTLAGTKDKKNAKEGSFEVVSHNKSNSLKYVEQSKMSSQTQNLSTANRYNTLSNDS